MTDTTDGSSGTSDDRDEPEATVLIVDDEADMRNLMVAWVEPHYDVLTAQDGEAALGVMSDDIDVVLLDRRMPVMDGDAFLRAMKEQEYDARVVMVTAVDPGPDIVDLPFDDYLTKPVTKEVVLDMIGRMLRLRRAGPAVREYHSLERRRDILRAAKATTGVSDPEAFERLTRRLEGAARDAGAGLAWLKDEYYDISRR